MVEKIVKSLGKCCVLVFPLTTLKVAGRSGLIVAEQTSSGAFGSCMCFGDRWLPVRSRFKWA